jgi:photosystem II stability/assembly factor-like uncharacterized protein
MASGDLTQKAAGSGEINLIEVKPGTSRLIAGIAGSGLWVSDDGAKTWTQLGTGPGSAPIKNGPTALIFDPQHPGTFWESGSYGPAMYKTTDDGATFTTLGDAQHVDVASVDLADPERKTILAGAHESKQHLYVSRDGGGTWMDIGKNLPEQSGITNSPLVLDASTFLVGTCATFQDVSCGVLRSSDGGLTWNRTTGDGPFGPALVTSRGAIYWALAGNGLIVSNDKGLTWTKSAPGPRIHLAGTVTELPDGRVVAMGETNLLATADGGKTWKSITAPLPFPRETCGTYGPGFTYVAALKKFFLSHVGCSGKLVADPIYSWDYDYTKP